MSKIKVSVIVPIYKVEKFIERCAKSLFEQTLSEVEFIFVDDASPDNSIDILKNILGNHPQCKNKAIIIQHKINKGLPAARNTGLNIAKGEYIFHCDSDDYVEPTMLEELYQTAIKNKADIVWCDWILSLAHNERYMKQPSYKKSIDAVKAMLSGAMKYNVWNKLIKHELYTKYNIQFPNEYGMGEDMTIIKLFSNAKYVTYVPKAYYHYVKTNTAAFSQTYSEKHLEELSCNIKLLENYLSNKFGKSLEKEIAFMKLEAKFPFLLSNDTSKEKEWENWYPETNKYIMLNKNIPLRSRILQWLASKHYWFLVRSYRWMFNHIIYGLIYR